MNNNRTAIRHLLTIEAIAVGALIIAFVIVFSTIRTWEGYPTFVTDRVGLGHEVLLEEGDIDIPKEFNVSGGSYIHYSIWHNESTDDLMLEFRSDQCVRADDSLYRYTGPMPGQGTDPQSLATDQAFMHLGHLESYRSGRSLADQVIQINESDTNFKSYGDSSVFAVKPSTQVSIQDIQNMRRDYKEFIARTPSLRRGLQYQSSAPTTPELTPDNVSPGPDPALDLEPENSAKKDPVFGQNQIVFYDA